ncbi:MAG: diguanylate cyclase [Solirubrobacterales bacterium]|nr:diguanylate cyclase [Solirubrobacterales bacterium]
MIALAILVSEVATDSASGKTDARLDAGLRTATNLYDQAQAEAGRAAEAVAAELAADPAAASALASGSEARIEALARAYARGRGIVSLGLEGSGGASASAGDPGSVASVSTALVAAGGEAIGAVRASTTTSRELVERIERTTGERAALVGPRVTGLAPIEPGALPDPGDSAQVEISGEERRVAATEPLGGEGTRIAIVAPVEGAGFLASEPGVAIIVAVFFVVALFAVLFIFRSLQGHVRQMLDAARRIGAGDFSSRVPVTGRDEMAGLANELNRMSGRLGDQMDELRRQRVEIERSVRRIGEAFASGLDRDALLAALVETAVAACEAEYGLVALRGHAGAQAEAGEATEAGSEVALAAERRALRAGGPIEAERGGAFALSSPLGRIGGSDRPVGAMTIVRRGRPFTSGERELFTYLLGQASTSVENVALHELVSEQAVTDDLTGLANVRAFRQVVAKEASRATRFGHDLSVLFCDLDDFKRINDTHGHPQGDAVLRAVGHVLASESRGSDEPARYGGEEFAVALPETGAQGAFEVAERIRAAVAERSIALLDGTGAVRVTVSIGVATAPPGAVDVGELVAAADAALYEAKRTGKNRVCAATPRPGGPGTGAGAADREGTEAQTAKIGTIRGIRRTST